MITQNATFVLRSCYVNPDCRLYFSDPSLKFAQLLMHILKIKGLLKPEGLQVPLFPQTNPDGDFTLE